MKICIAATIKFSKRSEGIGDLIARCYQDLLRDASLDIGDIDTSCILNFSGHFFEQCHLSALRSSRLPSNPNPRVGKQRVHPLGTALKQASIAIASGLYNLIEVVGAVKNDYPRDRQNHIILSYAGG